MVDLKPTTEYPGLQHHYARRDATTRYLDYAAEIAKDGTCLRRQVGAVIVRDNSVLATGFNGSPPGLPHCNDVYISRVPGGPRQVYVGCALEKDAEGNDHCVRTIHAEHNAILQAARNGVKLAGATLYATLPPCGNCRMILITVGITEWIYPGEDDYVSRIKGL